MRYSAVFVAFTIGIGIVITAPAEPAKGNINARLAVSTNEVAATDKSYKKQNSVIASEAKKRTSDHDSEDQSYMTYNRFKSIKSHDIHRNKRCVRFGKCKTDLDCCDNLYCYSTMCVALPVVA